MSTIFGTHKKKKKKKKRKEDMKLNCRTYQDRLMWLQVLLFPMFSAKHNFSKQIHKLR